jgi:basic membrane protein A
MKSVFRVRFGLVALLILATLATSVAITRPSRAQKAVRVTNVVNGTLGDKAFFDSAQRGLERAKKDLGIEFKTIELTEDASKWEPGLLDAMADVDNYDVLITGTFQMADFMTANADKYPDKKFIIYDTAVDYTKCKCTNVYSVEYAQNEGSYLAGVFAAAIIKEGKVADLSGKNVIGVMGGLDIPIINDFIVAYEQGAKSVDPSITVLKQYVGGDKPFFDPPKGKEIALAMYEQGANFVFNVAAGSGLGIFDAAVEKKRYAIGVDSDQWLTVKDSNPTAAERILTSMLKNVDNSLFRALSLDKEGKLAYGKREVIGLKDTAVGLAKNDLYNKIASDDVKKLVDQAEADVKDGKITVATAFEKAPATPAATMAATAAK